MNLNQLEKLLKTLPFSKLKKIFSIYYFDFSWGSQKLPANFPLKIIEKMGGKNKIEKQMIIRIENKLTQEAALFNPLRSKRPMIKGEEDLYYKIFPKIYNCPFCKDKNNTPEEEWGRLEGKYSYSCSNIAKYDSLHGMIIFKKHDFWNLKIEELKEGFSLAKKWFKKFHSIFPEKKLFPYLMWNGRWRGGASLEHPHLHLLLAHKKPYPKIGKIYQINSHFKKNKQITYFDYLKEIYTYLKLSLTTSSQTTILPYLTPIRNGEIWFWNYNYQKLISDFIPCFLYLHHVDLLPSFNLAIYFPPFSNKKKGKFPYLLRLIERGPTSLLPSDISGMGIFAGTDVASTDPYYLREKIQEFFYEKKN